MSHFQKLILTSSDTGLLTHWQKVWSGRHIELIPSFDQLRNLPLETEGVVWLDMSLPFIPVWTHEHWQQLLLRKNTRVVAASSSPQDSEAIAALDAGCVGYCHAFSDPETLLQVEQVVEAGHVWIGSKLMQRLIHSASHAAPLSVASHADWSSELTAREREVAILAANGASNQIIATDCNISERTVKAHLSSVFSKLNISDRLQLALRVHGIN